MQLFAEGKLSTIYGCNIRWRVEIFFLVELFNDAFLFPIYKKDFILSGLSNPQIQANLTVVP